MRSCAAEALAANAAGDGSNLFLEVILFCYARLLYMG